MSKFKITYEVEDEYAGKSRPQCIIFDSEDVCDEEEWECFTEDEKQETIADAVRDHFEQNISWSITDKEEI